MIRLLTPDDAEELAALYRANRDFLAPFSPARLDDSFFTAAGQRERIERAAADDAWWFAIVDHGELVGTVNLTDVTRGVAELAHVGYWVDHARNGRGLATSAVADVIEFAFGQAGLHRLEAATLPENVASQRVLEKNGFERFGLARRLLRINGDWRDHLLFERIAD